MKHKRVVLGVAVVMTGLSAGLFYAYAISVNPAFRHLSDETYIAAMQAIDRDIQNPIFFISFLARLYYYR